MNNRLIWSLLLAGMSLGTAWAIRGQFGHEQGAAWAGGFGAIAIILLAKRPDWYARLFPATLASALGWGVTGMISYGIVVGYGRSTDFGNAYYGLGMLFLIGALFGFLGGGLFGLALSSSRKKPVQWHLLMAELVAAGVIGYYLLIEQLGYLMTPPRSEAWAVCFGMAASLLWYLVRNGYGSALRVAFFSALGAGFGFGFGNFLQTMGHVSEIAFNFWNVMEYSIGFFGGIGMAYGTFTSEWETDEESGTTPVAPLLLVALVIPFLVWEQSVTDKRLIETLEPLGGDSGTAAFVRWVALALLLAFAVWSYRRFAGKVATYADVSAFFFLNLALYTAYSLIITGAFMSLYRPEQYLYIVNWLVLLVWMKKVQTPFASEDFSPREWTLGTLATLVFVGGLAYVASQSHGEIKGAHNRFEISAPASVSGVLAPSPAGSQSPR